MGLISMPFLNRVGIYSYWNSIWNKNFNYSYFLHFDFFLKNFFFFFFENLVFSLLLKFFNNKLLKYKRGFLKHFSTNLNIMYNVYLGKIWFFMFHNYIIIKVSLYVSNTINKNTNIKYMNFLKLSTHLLKNIKLLKYTNKYNFMNYKYNI
jgi:hypothetical protein